MPPAQDYGEPDIQEKRGENIKKNRREPSHAMVKESHRTSWSNIENNGTRIHNDKSIAGGIKLGIGNRRGEPGGKKRDLASVIVNFENPKLESRERRGKWEEGESDTSRRRTL